MSYKQHLFFQSELDILSRCKPVTRALFFFPLRVTSCTHGQKCAIAALLTS